MKFRVKQIFVDDVFKKLDMMREILGSYPNIIPVYYTLYQNTEFLLDDKRVLILNGIHLSICRSTIPRYC